MEASLAALRTASVAAGFGADAVTSLDRAAAAEVLDTVSLRFTGAKCRPPWWDRLVQLHVSRRFPDFDAYASLVGLVPDPNQRCWLIVPDGEYLPAVVEATPRVAQALVAESSFLEYYLVAADLTWLLCENDHGVLIGAGVPVTDRDS